MPGEQCLLGTPTLPPPFLPGSTWGRGKLGGFGGLGPLGEQCSPLPWACWPTRMTLMGVQWMTQIYPYKKDCKGWNYSINILNILIIFLSPKFRDDKQRRLYFSFNDFMLVIFSSPNFRHDMQRMTLMISFFIFDSFWSCSQLWREPRYNCVSLSSRKHNTRSPSSSPSSSVSTMVQHSTIYEFGTSRIH